MKATDFLRKQVVGYQNGEPVYSRRSLRGFLLLLLAGKRAVVLNAKFEDGALIVGPGDEAIVVNATFLSKATKERP